MAIKKSLRRALVFSGLVDDNPRSNPDFLRNLAGEPPSELPSELPPAGDPASADHPDSWSPGHAPEDPAAIVVRRAGADATQEFAPAPQPLVAPPPPPAAAAPPPPPPAPALPAPTPRPVAQSRPAPPPPRRDVGVHRLLPRSFNDAQKVADLFKAGTPVVLDIQALDDDLARRLIAFASGLTYGLDGGMERLEGRVFLLVPPGVEVPQPQRDRLAAQGSLATSTS